MAANAPFFHISLKEEDVPGAKLPYSSVEKHSNSQLRRWLQCPELKSSGNKEELVKRFCLHTHYACVCFPETLRLVAFSHPCLTKRLYFYLFYTSLLTSTVCRRDEISFKKKKKKGSNGPLLNWLLLSFVLRTPVHRLAHICCTIASDLTSIFYLHIK